MYRALFLSVIGMVCSGALLTIGQIWFSFLDADIFIKILITLGILVALCGFVLIAGQELNTKKKLKDEGYLD